jgi:hypothetical protein
MEKQSLVTKWIRVDLVCDGCDAPFEDTGNRECSMGGVITHKIYRCPRCGTTQFVPIDKSYPHYVGVPNNVEENIRLFEVFWVINKTTYAEVVVAKDAESAKRDIRNRLGLEDVSLCAYGIDRVGGYKILLVKE